MEKQIIDEDIIEEEDFNNETVNMTANRSIKNTKSERGLASKEGRIELKEKREKNKRIQDKLALRPMIEITEPSFFIACYDPFEREFYFLNFITEQVIRKEFTVEEHEILEIIPKRMEVYDKDWESIIELSQLGKDEFLSSNYYSFFERPLNSSCLFAECLGLNNFNSTYPLPMCYSNYEVNLIISFHSGVISDDKKIIPDKDLIINRKVGFFYVVDTIIKDSLRVLMNRLRSLIEQDEEEDETNNNYMADTQNKPYTSMFNKLSKNIKCGNYKFVLKLKQYEEYLYGDYPICTYEPIRTLVREFEPVSLFLMMYEKEKVIPPISHYPPILYQPEKTLTDYYDLTKRYLDSFPENCIVYKTLPKETQSEYFFKSKPLKRRAKLTKYCESGEADFPCSIKIRSISNLFAIKYHINSKNYNHKEVILPYFVQLESKEDLKNKQNILEKMGEKMIKLCKKKDKNKTHKDAQEEKKDEEKHHKNQIKNIMTKYPHNISLHDELNYMKIHKNKKKGENAFSKLIYNSLKTNTPEYKLTKLTKLSKSLKDYNTYQVCYHSESNQIEDNSEKNIFNIQDRDEFTQQFENLKYEDEIKNPLFEETLLLQDYQLPQKIAPIFLKLEIMLYYGCYEIYKMDSRFMIINNNINVNEKMIIPTLIWSHLPKESRISVNLLAYDKLKNKYFVLGSCSISIFDQFGYMKEGPQELNFWPLFQIDPRIVCADNYLGKEYLSDPLANVEYDKNKYCSIILEFPIFPKKLAYTLKTPYSYKEFLKLKHPNSESKINYCKEITDLYSSSLDHLDKIISSLKNRDQYFIDLDKKQRQKLVAMQKGIDNKHEGKNEESKRFIKDEDISILDALELSLPNIINYIARDPLTPFKPNEISEILYCRDYICTIPSALEIFLRAINWFDPLQVYIAHNYLKKWKKIDSEDAISLLDARFPDTHVRQYAISILREMTDDLLNLYMMQMCQSLVFESQLINPLSNFLIEKSIQKPLQIGVIFFWNALVSMKNPLFKQRLNIFLAYIFSIKGPTYFSQISKSYEMFKLLKAIGLGAKNNFQVTAGNNNDKKSSTKAYVQNKLHEIGKKVENFYFPIHNSFFGKKIDHQSSSVFGSKMVPVKISAITSDDSILNVIFKSGDDLRQDVLTLQILKVMDKMWLDNDLDLKITAYKVLPTGITDGFIQFVSAKEIDSLQMDQGFSGAFDRELLNTYLRKVGQVIQNGQPKYDLIKQQENFVKSLAGFCVATCVMGIGDRHLGNVMLKDNGIFLHIDYGHFLGNFKYKLGIKRERAPFLLTPEMARVYSKTGREEQFKLCCVKAYNILRKNATRLMNLFIIMSTAGLPELNGINDVIYLRKMLHLDKKNDEDAGNYFIGLINQSKNEKFRLVDNIIHNFKHG